MNRIRHISLAVAAACALAAGSTAMASPQGGSHGGGGHFATGHAVVHAGWGGYHGGWGGYRGGWGGWHGGWGYGWGFWGAGLWLATLPWGYSTYWWGGVPYYYYDNTYYNWNGASGVYQAVPPPPGRDDGGALPPAGPAPGASAPQGATAGEFFMYPKAGQSAEQQAKDRYECHQWAAQQAGFDPTQPSGGVPADQAGTKRAEYLRADGACLEGRNYSVK
jgi:hypothetical protein